MIVSNIDGFVRMLGVRDILRGCGVRVGDGWGEMGLCSLGLPFDCLGVFIRGERSILVYLNLFDGELIS